MNYDQLILTLKIRSPDFLRDVKHAFVELKKHGVFPDLTMRQIDQAVAAGFGFFTAENALEALKSGSVAVKIDDAAFRERVAQLAKRNNIEGDVAPGVFIMNVHQCLMDSNMEGSAGLLFKGRPFPVPERAPGFRERPLRDAKGNVVLVPIPGWQIRNNALGQPMRNPALDWAVEQGRLLQEAITSGKFRPLVS